MKQLTVNLEGPKRPEIVYGRAEPLDYQMAHFADPIWGLQRYNTGALQKGHGYNHARMRIFTQRWGTVLRHSIGQFGRAAFCDELGWVSVEEFIRNDHAWPIDGTSAWNYQTRDYRPEVLDERRNILMEGYWYTLNHKPIKRTLMIAYDADRLARSGGWIRPLAIRATSGHSFSGDHKHPLSVNIDYDRMNMTLTKELAWFVRRAFLVSLLWRDFLYMTLFWGLK